MPRRSKALRAIDITIAIHIVVRSQCTFWPACASKARTPHSNGISDLGARAAGRDFGQAGEQYACAQGIIAMGQCQRFAMLAAPHLCRSAMKCVPERA